MARHILPWALTLSIGCEPRVIVEGTSVGPVETSTGSIDTTATTSGGKTKALNCPAEDMVKRALHEFKAVDPRVEIDWAFREMSLPWELVW